MREMTNSITGIPQILEKVESDSLLIQIYQLEPVQLEQIVDLAFTCEWPDERWQEYARLKRMASQFAGWNAKHPELRTAGHYDVVLAFIDWLLPEARMEDAG
jgi:hypothetical protein